MTPYKTHVNGRGYQMWFCDNGWHIDDTARPKGRGRQSAERRTRALVFFASWGEGLWPWE